jgi:hypothetical protein
MSQEILKPFLLDVTGQQIVIALQGIAEQLTAIKEELQKQNQSTTDTPSE